MNKKYDYIDRHKLTFNKAKTKEMFVKQALKKYPWMHRAALYDIYYAMQKEASNNGATTRA